MIQVEVSYKVGHILCRPAPSRSATLQYSEADVHTMFTEAELRPVQRWTDKASQYSLWLLERPPFMFPLITSPSASVLSGSLVPKRSYSSPFSVPAVQDWHNMWTAWDFITRRMIPDSMLFQKPIDLRHICLFYLGHIPTFLDIHLSRLLGEPHTEPEDFKYIFEVCCFLLLGMIVLTRCSAGLILTLTIRENAMSVSPDHLIVVLGLMLSSGSL